MANDAGGEASSGAAKKRCFAFCSGKAPLRDRLLTWPMALSRARRRWGNWIGPCRRPPRTDSTPARRGGAGDGSGSALGRCLRRLRRSHGSGPDGPDEAQRQQQRLNPVAAPPASPANLPCSPCPPSAAMASAAGARGLREIGSRLHSSISRRAAARTRALGTTPGLGAPVPPPGASLRYRPRTAKHRPARRARRQQQRLQPGRRAP